jgi:multiple sugar transport system substrate-binding protein
MKMKMKKLKRTFAIVMASLMLLAALTACGGNDGNSGGSAPASSASTGSTAESAASESSAAESAIPASAEPESSASAEEAAPPAEGGSEVIKFAISEYIYDWGKERADAFMAENPGKTVELIEIAGEDAATKMLMMMQSAETAPDVIQEDGFMVKPDAAAKYLEPLDSYIAGWEDYSQITPAILENGRGSDGIMYGIPYYTDVQGIWYDKDLFAAAGLPIPFEPKTCQEVLDAGKAIKAANAGTEDFIPIFVYNTEAQDASMRTFQFLFNGTGGTLYDNETGKWIVDKENFGKALDFVDTIYNKEKMNGPLGVITATNVNELIIGDHLMEGRCGIFISVNAVLSLYNPSGPFPWPEALDHLGYVKMPTNDGGNNGYLSISGGHVWSVPALGANKAGGFEFIKFLTNYDSTLDYCLRHSAITVRGDVAEDPAYGGQDFSVNSECADMLKYTYVRPAVEGYATVSTLYADMVESVTLGSTPDEAIATFEAEIARIIGDDKVETR